MYSILDMNSMREKKKIREDVMKKDICTRLDEDIVTQYTTGALY